MGEQRIHPSFGVVVNGRADDPSSRGCGCQGGDKGPGHTGGAKGEGFHLRHVAPRPFQQLGPAQRHPGAVREQPLARVQLLRRLQAAARRAVIARPLPHGGGQLEGAGRLALVSCAQQQLRLALVSLRRTGDCA